MTIESKIGEANDEQRGNDMKSMTPTGSMH
jgi:hypothetical protein